MLPAAHGTQPRNVSTTSKCGLLFHPEHSFPYTRVRHVCYAGTLAPREQPSLRVFPSLYGSGAQGEGSLSFRRCCCTAGLGFVKTVEYASCESRFRKRADEGLRAGSFSIRSRYVTLPEVVDPARPALSVPPAMRTGQRFHQCVSRLRSQAGRTTKPFLGKPAPKDVSLSLGGWGNPSLSCVTPWK